MEERDLKPLALVELGTFPLHLFVDFGEPFVQAFQNFLKRPRGLDISFVHLLGFGQDGAWVIRTEDGNTGNFFPIHPLFASVFCESGEQQAVVPGVDSRIVTFWHAITAKPS